MDPIIEKLKACGILSWLYQAVSLHSSDLFLCVGECPLIRLYGTFKYIDEHVLSASQFQQIIETLLPLPKLRRFSEGQEVDVGLDVPGFFRFRLSVFRHQNGQTLAIRPIPYQIPTIDELRLPEVFHYLTRLQRGLIIITGPACSGKSTTLAAFMNAINHREERHIITIEDPIEYIIPHKHSIIHQREVGWHTSSFDEGLRSALRASPNVIVVGELRDLESIQLAIRAAETGHLVLGTLHSGTVTQSITRLLDIFDSLRQPLIRVQLAQSIQAICAQRLLKRLDGRGMVVATEVMIGTLAIKNIIRQDRFSEIRGYMETGMREHMHTFAQSSQLLLDQQLIDSSELYEITDGSPVVEFPLSSGL